MKEFNISALWEKPAVGVTVFTALVTLLYTIQCSVFQTVLGLDILETVVWGAQGAWGYGKHPPLSGWVGYAFSLLANHADWGLYLAAELCIAVGVFFVYKQARLFWEDWRAATATLLLFTLFYYNPSEVKFSTYFIEIALRPAIIYFFYLALQRQNWGYWLTLGFLCGLGVLNKYSIGLLFVPMAFIALMKPEYRKQLWSWKFLCVTLVFVAVIAPHVVWLVNHDFACFRHVGGRMEEEHSYLQIFSVLGTALYPFAVETIFVIAAMLPLYKTVERQSPQWQIAMPFLILTLFPSAVFFLISICGGGVILMWFCSMFAWTGIIVVALFPWRINEKVFKWFFLLLCVYTITILAITTYDVACNSNKKIHADPLAIVKIAEDFWRERRGDEPIPVVVGGLWFAGVVENYSVNRPPACEMEDDVFFERYREVIDERGALVIGSKRDNFTDFEDRVNYKLNFEQKYFQYKARWGETKNTSFLIAYYPSKAEREKAMIRVPKPEPIFIIRKRVVPKPEPRLIIRKK